jgi:hypothetical protein
MVVAVQALGGHRGQSDRGILKDLLFGVAPWFARLLIRFLASRKREFELTALNR